MIIRYLPTFFFQFYILILYSYVTIICDITLMDILYFGILIFDNFSSNIYTVYCKFKQNKQFYVK